jgi:triacylglycerol lipase
VARPAGGRACSPSEIWRDDGAADGPERPVVGVPGFLAADLSLGMLTTWLRRSGYRTRRARIGINTSCTEDACASREELLEELARRGRRVAIVGPGRGGVLAKALAAARPDLVCGS